MAIWNVNAGGNLQAAFTGAAPGDEILLESGATFLGNFTLPSKGAGSPIIVHTDTVLPSRRIEPGDAGSLAKIGSSNSVQAMKIHGTSGWLFDGIELLPNSKGYNNVVWVEDSNAVTFDRILFIGLEPYGQRRVILGNGTNMTVTRCHFENVFVRGNESNAYCAYNGAGPHTITDNFFEVAGINILFGGSKSDSVNDIPADILVEGNYLTKKWEWHPDEPTKATVKNLLELKSAKRVIIRNNYMERCWAQAQAGFAIQITTKNSGGGASWSVVDDVLIERNVIKDTERGINILGIGYDQPSGQTDNLVIQNNYLFTSNIPFQIGGEAGSVTIQHNSVFNGSTFCILYTGTVWPNTESTKRAATCAAENLVIKNNLAYYGNYGLFSSSGIGTAGLEAMTLAYTWTHNVLAGGSGTYPAITWFPSISTHDAEFENDYTLKTTSTYIDAGDDGLDLGVTEGVPTYTPPAPGTGSQGGDNLALLTTNTKLYARGDDPTFIPSTIRGDWDDTAGAATKAMALTKEGGGITDTVAVTESTATSPFDVLLYRGVGPALEEQTISGQLNVKLEAVEADVDADFHWHVHVYVTAGETDTVRGVLVTDYSEPAGTNEWPTAEQTVTLDANIDLTPVDCLQGDRVIVEIGFRSHNSHTTPRAGSLNYGTLRTDGSIAPDLV